MNGWFRIGGTDYLSPGTGAAIPNSGWLGGTSIGQGFLSGNFVGYDYNRGIQYDSIYANPRTGARWTAAQLNGTDTNGNNLQAFGVYVSTAAAVNTVKVCQVFLRVDYYTSTPAPDYPTVGTHTYHTNNIKYLHDPSDVPAGQRFYNTTPAHGYYDALWYQDCYDFCHRGNAGAPTFSAKQGKWMWYSVGGDPTDPVVNTRTLALKVIALPSDSPRLTFDTNYQLGAGAAGTVEVSTNGGASYAPLTGTVGGSSLSSLTGNAAGWVSASYDLSAYAGQSVKLRFKYINGSSSSAGWAFDSLVIKGNSGTVFSDDAETLKPDWTNSFWTRSMGAFPYI